jgi:diacylglycerol O-acyltransferase / wax synthase
VSSLLAERGPIHVHVGGTAIFGGKPAPFEEVRNLVISNVPGPQVPVYLLGRRLAAVHPFVPLSPQGHAPAIGVLCYDGGVFLGLVGDRDVLADMDNLVNDLEASLAEQLAAAR